jgi:hypothetical protein
MTQLERIKAMSVEEMAKTLSWINDIDFCYITSNGDIRDWLNSEVPEWTLK